MRRFLENRILKNENHEIEHELELWLAASQGIENTAIDFYRRRFAYEDDKMLEQYLDLRKLFFAHFEELNKKEQKIHLLSLLNDSSYLIKSTKLEITESLPLYKLGLDTGVILHQGQLTLNTYITIVSASNTNQDFSFTKHFIESYTSRLKREFQSDAESWAKGHQAYWQKNLADALNILSDKDFKLPYFQRIARLLLTQVYFDLHLKDDSYQFYLLNFFDAFEKWLLRDKDRASFNKKPYLRFIQICRKLAKAYGSVNFSSEQIVDLLENEDNIQASNWLKKKIEEIISLKI